MNYNLPINSQFQVEVKLEVGYTKMCTLFNQKCTPNCKTFKMRRLHMFYKLDIALS